MLECTCGIDNTVQLVQNVKIRRRNKILKFKKFIDLVGTTNSMKVKFKKKQLPFISLPEKEDDPEEGKCCYYKTFLLAFIIRYEEETWHEDTVMEVNLMNQIF